MKNFALRQKRLMTIISLAGMLASCGTGPPSNVKELRSIIGTELIGTKGQTEDDQDNINRVVVRSCGAEILTRAECARHGVLLQKRA